MRAALDKAEKDLGDLRTSHVEEKKKLEDEIQWEFAGREKCRWARPMSE
ncbi:hypothetical protein A2U01_0063136, partial [Trifolium medium]|nr:hypothetical protein [Trifolium medium]